MFTYGITSLRSSTLFFNHSQHRLVRPSCVLLKSVTQWLSVTNKTRKSWFLFCFNSANSVNRWGTCRVGMSQDATSPVSLPVYKSYLRKERLRWGEKKGEKKKKAQLSFLRRIGHILAKNQFIFLSGFGEDIRMCVIEFQVLLIPFPV